MQSGTTDPGQGKPLNPYLLLAWCAVLQALAFGPVLYDMAKNWYSNEDMGHGFFVPLVAGYLAWGSRDKLAAERRVTNWWGLAIVFVAACMLVVATLGVELFTSRLAFVVSLTGMVLLLGGRTWLRILSFPLFLLLFMIPLPAIIYNQITFPLQLLASRTAELLLGLIGIPVLRDGNILELPSQRLSVVEACSGIRSLLSLSFLSLIYGHFFDTRPWMKWVLLPLTVPIAIAANAGRVTITGILSEMNPELAKGFFHSAEGWVIFMVALVLLLMTHKLVSAVAARFFGSREPLAPVKGTAEA